MSDGKPRRRSIFAPLLLIALGTLLLMAEFRPDLPVWQWFADYWPVLLILWGVAKLIDYFMARQAGEGTPRGLTGGEVFLLLLILFFGASLSGMHWAREQWPDFDFTMGPFDRRFSFPASLPARAVRPNARISVNTDRGDITVQATEAAEVRVAANKSVAAMNEEEARRRADSVEIAIQDVAEGYEIKPVVNSDSQRGVRVDLDVQVPQQASLLAKTERGEARITGVTGPVTVNASNGAEIRTIGGNVEAEVRRGNVRVLGARGNVRIGGRGREIEVADISGEASIQGEFFGPIRVKNAATGVRFLSRRTDLTVPSLPGRLETSGGSVEIEDAPRGVNLITRDKDILLENVAGRIRIQNRHGNIQVRFRQAPQEEINIENESGSIELVLPPDSEFELSASSRNSEIESEFQSASARRTDDRRTSTLEMKVGTRGPRIQLRTTHDTIRIRKGS